MWRLTFSFYVITIDLLTHVYLSFEVVFQTPGSVYVSTDDLHWVPNICANHSLRKPFCVPFYSATPGLTHSPSTAQHKSIQNPRE